MHPPVIPNILLVMDDDGDEAHAVHILAKYHFSNSLMKLRRAREAIRLFTQAGSGTDNSVMVLPELIILSLEGFSLMEALSASRKGRLAEVPLVVVAGSRDEEEAIRGLNLPRTYVMGKPLGFFKLLEAMQKLGMYWMVLRSSPT